MFDVVKKPVRLGARGAAAVYTGGATETKQGKNNNIVKGVGKGTENIFSAGFSGLWDADDKAAEAAMQYQQEQAAERARRREAQLNILNTMQAPQMSPLAAKRIAALEAESAPRALAEDPLYVGQRAQLLGAGQQLQSGIENEALGRGVRGGFANVGSVQDVQDRLGVQLAGLAGQAQATRERKRDMAAQAQQAFQDAQTEFANAQRRAQMAIEAGDSDLALASIQQAYNARSQAAAAERQMYAAGIGTVGTIGGAMLGGPAGAMAGGQIANQATSPQPMGMQSSGGEYSLGANTDFGQPAQFEGFEASNTGSQISSQPFAASRRRGYY